VDRDMKSGLGGLMGAKKLASVLYVDVGVMRRYYKSCSRSRLAKAVTIFKMARNSVSKWSGNSVVGE
jgi:hypothetical protein